MIFIHNYLKIQFELNVSFFIIGVNQNRISQQNNHMLCEIFYNAIRNVILEVVLPKDSKDF